MPCPNLRTGVAAFTLTLGAAVAPVSTAAQGMEDVQITSRQVAVCST